MRRMLAALGPGLFIAASCHSIAPAQQPAQPLPLPAIAPNLARLEHNLAGLDGPGLAIDYGDHGGVLAAGCEHGTIQFWNKAELQSGRLGGGTPNVLNAHQGPVLALAWSAGPVLASAGADSKVHLWSMPDCQLVRTLETAGITRALAISPDRKLLAGGGDESVVQLWDIAAGTPTGKLPGPSDWVLCLAFSPDGKLLAAGGHDGTVRVWEVPSGKKLVEGPVKPPPAKGQAVEPAPSIWSVAFSPDGKQVAIGSADAQIHLVNVSDGKIARTLTGHASTITSLAFHAGGTVLASASKDRTVRLWSPANGQPIKVLEGHTSWVQGVTFLAHGTRLASVGADQTVRLWALTEPGK